MQFGSASRLGGGPAKVTVGFVIRGVKMYRPHSHSGSGSTITGEWNAETAGRDAVAGGPRAVPLRAESPAPSRVLRVRVAQSRSPVACSRTKTLSCIGRCQVSTAVVFIPQW